MGTLIANLLRWIFSKATLIAALWIVVIAGTAIFLAAQHYYRELPAEKQAKLQELADYEKQMARLESEATEASAALAELKSNAETEISQRRAELEKKADQVKQLEAWLGKAKDVVARIAASVGLYPEEKILARERELAEARREARKLDESIAKLTNTLSEAQHAFGIASQDRAAQRESLSGELAETMEEIEEIEGRIAVWERRFDKAKFWVDASFQRVAGTLLLITLSILLLPLLYKAALYFLWSPLAAAAEPIRIRTDALAPIRVSRTDVAKEIELSPGDFAIIKHKFYQASDELLQKRTKFLFDWRFPLTSAACGLIEMTRVRNTDPDHPRRLTLSSQDEAEVEMAVVDIPEGGSLICRPSFLAGFIGHEDRPPVVKSHWRIFRLHAWITLQFRFFEFRGPVRLVLWARRGVRAEILTADHLRQGNRKRTNQDATIAFTPGLDYSCARAETFWSYLRGGNPLFDDIFAGQGTFLCQQISKSGRAESIGKFWAQLWGGFTKVFDLSGRVAAAPLSGSTPSSHSPLFRLSKLERPVEANLLHIGTENDDGIAR
ncbi:MAG: hypothetical protein R3F11_06450 [Verrucomicrobiales bacterium]